MPSSRGPAAATGNRRRRFLVDALGDPVTFRERLLLAIALSPPRARGERGPLARRFPRAGRRFGSA